MDYIHHKPDGTVSFEKMTPEQEKSIKNFIEGANVKRKERGQNPLPPIKEMTFSFFEST